MTLDNELIKLMDDNQKEMKENINLPEITKKLFNIFNDENLNERDKITAIMYF
jgi:hypothetical protein